MDITMQDQMIYVAIGVLMLCVILLFIMMLVQAFKLKKLRRRYNEMMEGTGVTDLESVILDINEHLYALKEGQLQYTHDIQQIQLKMRKMVSQVGIHRYNAFEKHGSDLSFSISVLNDEKDGFVLSGLHNRDSVFVYAKPVEQGASQYTLSPEEEEAIALAERKK